MLMALSAVLAWTATAGAAPPDCQLIDDTVGDKFVMGAVVGHGSDDPMLPFRLRSAINMRFKAAESDLEDEARVVFCNKRWVTDQSEYDERVSQGLNDKRVLIEVWAQADEMLVALSFVVIPLRYYEFFRSPDPQVTGFHQAIYAREGQGAGRSGLPGIFRDTPELKALTALALGIRYEKNGMAMTGGLGRVTALEKAWRYYCDALTHLASARAAEDLDGLLRREREHLLAYVDAGTRRVTDALLDDPQAPTTLKIVAFERALAGEGRDDTAGTDCAGGDGVR